MDDLYSGFRRKRWPAGVELALRCVGICIVVGIIFYMSKSYLAGRFLKDDPVLTLITIMVFVLGTVFGVYCTAENWNESRRESKRKESCQK